MRSIPCRDDHSNGKEAAEDQAGHQRNARADRGLDDFVPEATYVLGEERPVVRQALAHEVYEAPGKSDSFEHQRLSPIISNTSPARPCSTALTEYMAMP